MAAKIELVKVNSSNITSVGMEGENLIIEYTSGVRYRYKNVPQSVYQKLLESESKGKFCNAEIKGKYEYERIVEG